MSETNLGGRGQRTDSHPDCTVLVVDNYDSFAYNLVQSVGSVLQRREHPDGGMARDRRRDVVVFRNDALTLADVDALDPDAIVVSPGPGIPGEAGISVPLFAEREYPTFGVCLGHQALCVANGGRVGQAPTVVHGKQSPVSHDGRGIFAGLPERLEVGRYHSLAVGPGSLPGTLTETARTVDGEGSGSGEAGESVDDVVMAVRHETRPHVGVQFHPESILTHEGDILVRNFLREYTDVGGRGPQ